MHTSDYASNFNQTQEIKMSELYQGVINSQPDAPEVDDSNRHRMAEDMRADRQSSGNALKIDSNSNKN